MPDSLNYGQIEPILLTALLRKLGPTHAGLSLDSFSLHAKACAGGSDAPGRQFILRAVARDGRDALLDPVYLFGFTTETAQGALANWCAHRIRELWRGRTDPFTEARNRLKTTRFGRMYGSGAAPEDEGEKLLCRLLGYPTQDEIGSAQNIPVAMPGFKQPKTTVGLKALTDQLQHFDYSGLEMRVAAGAVSYGGPSLVRKNAEADPNYCPYCMRCSGLVRMRKVGHMHWRCDCGAEHIETDGHDDGSGAVDGVPGCDSGGAPADQDAASAD